MGTLKPMLRPLRILTTTALALVVLAPAAHAQDPEPGVTVDPSSPAGKEYALPVPQARKDAQGKKDKSKSDTPLFGEGVKSNTTTTPPPTTTNSTPPPAASTGSSSSA